MRFGKIVYKCRTFCEYKMKVYNENRTFNVDWEFKFCFTEYGNCAIL